MLSGYKTYVSLWLPWIATLLGLISVQFFGEGSAEMTWGAFGVYTLYALQQTFARLGMKKAQTAAETVLQWLRPKREGDQR